MYLYKADKTETRNWNWKLETETFFLWLKEAWRAQSMRIVKNKIMQIFII